MANAPGIGCCNAAVGDIHVDAHGQLLLQPAEGQQPISEGHV